MTYSSGTGEKRLRSSQSETSGNLAEGRDESRPSPSSALTDSIQTPSVACPYSRQDQGNEGTPGPGVQPQDGPPFPLSAMHTGFEKEEVVITTIRATHVALGLRRLPAGFYTVVYHSGLEWKTEHKASSVNDDVVEWSGPIPIPSDLSAPVRLEVFASFEFQPMLGAGEQLRKLTTTVEQLLDRSVEKLPFTFFPKDGDVVSPCSSISVVVKQRKCENNNSSALGVLGHHWLTTESRGEVEDATNQGHNALSRYRKYGEQQDLKRSIQHFERALNICTLDHAYRAAAQSNLAMAKFILWQAEDTATSLEDPLRLYRNALAARPVGHVDRPSTLIHLAVVHLAQFQQLGEHAERAQAGALLHEAMQLSPTESYETRAASFMLQVHAGRTVHPVQPKGQSSVEDSASRLTDEDLGILGVRLLKHFERFGDIADLQQAIAILEELVRCTSIWDDRYCARLGNLGVALSYRFQHLGEPSDLEDAISRHRDAVDFTPDGLEKPASLSNLGNTFLIRFQHRGQLSDLEDAISTLRDAVDLAPHGHPDKLTCLSSLGNSFFIRFERLGQPSDLEDAISTQRDAIDLTPHGHPDRPRRLCNLGTFIFTRFRRLGQLGDLEDAISRQRAAVDLTPDGHPEKPAYLNNFGNSFAARFERLGKLSDLEVAILRQKDAVNLTPHGHPGKPAYLSNLGTSFTTRFRRLGQLGDLEDAISSHRDAVNLTPHGHPGKPAHLSNLGNSLFNRFQRLGQLSDLEDAISSHRHAVDLTPRGHPDKPRYLSNLGSSFTTRFRRLGQLSDLENAISRQRDAVDLTPHDHPDKSAHLNNLGNSYFSRFQRFGQLCDLEVAILRRRDAVDLIPHGHPDKPSLLYNLGTSFFIRFERLGQLSDLEVAILRQRDAVDLTPHGHPDKPAYLNTLGNSFLTRFERLGQQDDLEDAISRQRDAVDLTPHGHPEKPGRLTNLGNSFLARFRRLEQLNDLEDAISRHRDAVDLTLDDHPGKPAHLNNIGNSFFIRFEHLGQLSDLEVAISTQRDAVDLTPHGHPDKLARLNNLGNSFFTRFQRFGQLNDLEQAISLYSNAASTPIGAIGDRFNASQNWISCARRIRHHTLLHAYSVGLGLLPQLAWIGLSLSHRYYELMRGADLVREAAAAALDAGFPETAMEWVEQGRSIVWGELFQLRSSHEELSAAHPDHARRLQELSAALENASATHEKSLSMVFEHIQSTVWEPSAAAEPASATDEKPLSALTEQIQSTAYHATLESLKHSNQEADRRRMLAIERDKLLQEIRRLAGFEQFLLRKRFSQLRASAHSGPVVILNAAETRCDALIVLADVNHVIHVPLPSFTFQRSTGLQNMLEKLLGHARVIPGADERKGNPSTWRGISWESLLSTLWNGVVRLILDSLAFTTSADLSRIFWCPTGPFVFLPIHAAGFYGLQHSQPGHKVSDFVVSSYAPSLSILALPPNLPVVPTGDLRLLAVRQPPSDGQSPLPGVATELEHIKEVIKRSPSAHTVLVESLDGTVEEVLGLMKEADWVHFACHGIQDDLDSGLCLADRRRLKLRDIVALSRPRGGLAFLSACQTATGEERLSDETIHIAAGMLFAGYGGVIGTMWSISDKLAPRVARDVYRELFRNGTRPDYREAAHALHEAIGSLRDRNVSFVEWLPFIHVGL